MILLKLGWLSWIIFLLKVKILKGYFRFRLIKAVNVRLRYLDYNKLPFSCK
jgi:hypothetical protein